MEIEISGYCVLIDDEDFEKISKYKWSLDKQYRREGLCYATTTAYVDGEKETVKMHRIIMGCIKGDGLKVDHINHNTLDNRKENLRVCDNQQNAMNKCVSKNCTTGYKGVWFRSDTRVYRAMVRTGGKRYNCGQYVSPEEAAKAYDKMSLHLFKEFAHLNFPEEVYTSEEINNMSIYVENQRKDTPTSKYKGVALHRKMGRWVASITHNKIQYYLGLYNTEEEAARIRDKKAIELFGNRAKLNFPMEEYTKEQENEQQTEK